jgi:excinuclease ABC subunit C
MISEEDYARDIAHTDLFLRGKAQTVVDDLVSAMESASARMDYEQAAVYRDQINGLNYILEKQYVSGTSLLNVDVIACVVKGGQCCVQVFYFRDGANHGNKAFFPKMPNIEEPVSNIMEAFVSQFYLANEIPHELVVSHSPFNQTLLENVLSERAGRKLVIKHKTRGDRSKWLAQAMQNAQDALDMKLASHSNQVNRLNDLQRLFKLDELPKRIECFDISHSQGDSTVASCVVFNEQGPVKSDYRRFNIKGIKAGDDYAAIAQAFERRYSRVLRESGILPDIILIDGGKGQLSAACDIAETLFADEGPLIVGVSKGPARKPGMEQLHIAGHEHPVQPGHRSSALLLIQQIRDEAHRFAITGHRQKSRKKIIHSSLEDIPGLGPKRRHQLVQYFGGIHGITRAGIEDLQRIKGISRSLATRIYEHLHSH